MSNVKMIKFPNSDSMYAVVVNNVTVGAVTRVGYGATWTAHTDAGNMNGKRYAFKSRVAALNALLRVTATGDTSEIFTA